MLEIKSELKGYITKWQIYFEACMDIEIYIIGMLYILSMKLKQLIY